MKAFESILQTQSHIFNFLKFLYGVLFEINLLVRIMSNFIPKNYLLIIKVKNVFSRKEIKNLKIKIGKLIKRKHPMCILAISF